MNYEIGLNNRPFLAIKVGTKKVEVRTPKNSQDKTYDLMMPGDTITFENNATFVDKITCEVTFVKRYETVRDLLETEGTKNVLSSGGNVEEGITGI